MKMGLCAMGAPVMACDVEVALPDGSHFPYSLVIPLSALSPSAWTTLPTGNTHVTCWEPITHFLNPFYAAHTLPCSSTHTQETRDWPRSSAPDTTLYGFPVTGGPWKESPSTRTEAMQSSPSSLSPSLLTTVGWYEWMGSELLAASRPLA
jgi:hypothetical protein